jgi:hypothetical protein
MTINIIITTTIISSIISSLVTYLLKHYFDRRLEFYFNEKLEKIKIELAHQSEVNLQNKTRRLDIYPRLVELVYRLRNNVRDISSEKTLPLPQVITFLNSTDEYIEEIYHSRLDLERDQLFLILHDFKNLLISVKTILLNWMSLENGSSGKDTICNQLQLKYKKINNQYSKIVRVLTKITNGDQ